jgi:hypothetical protein
MSEQKKGVVIEPLQIKQGTTRTVTITNIRDADGNVLDPTAWGIHGVARPGYWAAPVAVWRNSPNALLGELLAEVVDADPPAEAGEKQIELHIDPEVSAGWHWSVVNLDVEMREPITNRQETFSVELQLIPTTVRTL